MNSILYTTHMNSCGSFFFLQLCNSCSEPGILLFGFKTVHILFNHADPSPIFDNVEDEHVFVIIGTDYGFCSTTSVHNNLVRSFVCDETVDCSLELIEIGEYGFVCSTVAFANTKTSDPTDLGQR